MHAARGSGARAAALGTLRCGVCKLRGQTLGSALTIHGHQHWVTAGRSPAGHCQQQDRRLLTTPRDPPPSAATPAAHAHTAAAVAAAPPSLVATFMELSKFRLSSLVCFTTATGYLAAGGPIEPLPFTATCVGTMLAACSASSFNQVIEAHRDARMKRTQTRPLPSGRISREQGLLWGAATGAASCGILLAGANPLTAALGAGNIFLYAVPYTLSKTRTEANTWIGSIVGAVPPLMGWSAATGGLGALDPLLLGSALFLWQFPHFFALSWMYRTDYARGGFKMVPCADPTGDRTSRLISRYSWYMAPLPIVAAATGVTSWMFSVEGTIINAVLLYRAHRFRQERTNAHAKDVFKVSLWYLPALLVLFVFHSKRWRNRQEAAVTDETAAGLFAQLQVLQAHLRGACVHELLARDDHSALCPAVVAEDAAEVAKEAAVTATAAAAAGAAVTQE